MNIHLPRLIAWLAISAGGCGIAFTLAGSVAAFAVLILVGLILLWLES